MEAVIKRIELKKFFKNYYFVVEIQDIDGNVYVIDKPFCSDEENFRKVVFGLMASCNQFDLLRFCTENPLYKNVVGYYNDGLKIIENEKDQWFSYDSKQGKFFCASSSQELKDLYDRAEKRRIPNIYVNDGKIESITSASGVFQIFFHSKSYGTFMNTGQIYYGFGYPIGIGTPDNKENVKIATGAFQSFILSIMDFYGVADLLHLGGVIDHYPEVEITVNRGKVTSITSSETGMGFSIGKDYKIINAFEPKNVKITK